MEHNIRESYAADELDKAAKSKDKKRKPSSTDWSRFRQGAAPQ